MIPQHWLSFDVLPKNANGKTDRPRLRELFALQFGPAVEEQQPGAV
jgi:acyl-coenzyme A synthetase/AMP-(fatty) acid ligase